YSDIIDRNFQAWVFKQNAGHIHFTDEQMDWLRTIKDFIATNLSITKDDLDLPIFADRGGLGKFYTVFGSRYESILDEMNLALAA
ncbi:MAG: hypothetical protein LBM77_08220, partial [Spirochaetaceae bacterium]|nr:hypothetical protein [Spirochaetaceae bacterium]